MHRGVAGTPEKSWTLLLPSPEVLRELRERLAQPGSGHWSGLPKSQCSSTRCVRTCRPVPVRWARRRCACFSAGSREWGSQVRDRPTPPTHTGPPWVVAQAFPLPSPGPLGSSHPTPALCTGDPVPESPRVLFLPLQNPSGFLPPVIKIFPFSL